MTARSALAATALLAAGLAACSPSGGDPKTAQAPPAAAAAAPAPAPAPMKAAAQAELTDPVVQQRIDQINKALYTPVAPAAAGTAPSNATSNTTAGGATGAPDAMLLKAEVLLARAGFSPGVIDGTPGTNLRHAVAAFASAQGLESDGDITPAVWARLNAPGAQPVAGAYTITAEDAAGPYYPAVGEDLWKLSKLDHAGYTMPLEALAERFHMSQEALQALNPGADFGKAGVVLAVAQVGDVTLPKIDHIQVDKANAAVRGYDKDDKLIAFAPATVGSPERPSPSGTHKVKGVARNPTYEYDPQKLTWGPRKHGKFTVPSGPNNPVGIVWIALDAPSYGLHGSPGPKLIGKTGSHGCVRMTNWDAMEVADAVKPGVVVTFLNQRGDPKSAN